MIKMIKNKAIKYSNAFTLAEVLICLMIIGVMAIIMIRNLRTKDFTEKSYIAGGYKAIESVQQASLKIRDIETASCPTGSFMVNVAGTWEYALVNASGANANTTEVLNLYDSYLKLENTGLNFCDYTGYCSNDSIKGAKLPGNTYIGFETTGVINCPSYYLPNSSSLTAGKGKCWGKLYIDVDGPKGPNQLGKDVFVMGLNEDGVAY